MKNRIPHLNAEKYFIKSTLHLFALLLFLLIPMMLHAQVSIPELLNRRQSIIPKYQPRAGEPGFLYLEMDFNSPIINNPKLAAQLKDKVVVKVELLYTAFQVSPEFRQPELNRKRLEELKKLAPHLFNNSSIVWEFTGQNACKNETEAKEFYHGFVITFRTPLSSMEEIEGVKRIAISDSLGKISYEVKISQRLKKRTKFSGYYEPRSERKKEKGIKYSNKSLWNRKRMMTVSFDTIRSYDTVARFDVSGHAGLFLSNNLQDTTIFSVLQRNENWKDILFVVDVTGSMSPYSTQLLVWNRLNFNHRRAAYYTFFNDGDNTPDNRKRIGSTGGIYHTAATNIRDVENTALLAMRKGGGGDIPENNIEAVLAAMKKFPAAGDIVLVADNLAPVKDIILLIQLNKPVHIILCGTAFAPVHPDYLLLARKTKGSIHTLEQDLGNLETLTEGMTIQVGTNTYIFSKGKFRLLLKE